MSLSLCAATFRPQRYLGVDTCMHEPATDPTLIEKHKQRIQVTLKFVVAQRTQCLQLARTTKGSHRVLYRKFKTTNEVWKPKHALPTKFTDTSIPSLHYKQRKQGAASWMNLSCCSIAFKLIN